MAITVALLPQAQRGALDVAITNTTDPRNDGAVRKAGQEEAALPFDSRVLLLGRHDSIVHQDVWRENDVQFED